MPWRVMGVCRGCCNGCPEEARWELLEGRPRAMSPAPGRLHQGVLIHLATRFDTCLQGKTCRVYPAPLDIRLPQGEVVDADVDTMVQPDLSGICDPQKLDTKGCRGAPDLVVEVTSPSSAAYDQIVKKALYELHGVREYWIVQPIDHVAWVYRRTDAGAFGPSAIFGPEDRIEVGIFDDLTIELSDVFRE